MKAGWKTNTLEDCLERFRVPAKIQRKQFREAGAFPIVSQEADFVNGYWDKSEDVCVLDRPVVIFGDHTQVLKYVDFDFVVGADGVKVLAPKPFIDAKYLYYFVMANRAPSLGYARHYRHVMELAVSYPDPEEQQRIVAVLDEAFEGLARARAHAEANLQNARELFASATHTAFSDLASSHASLGEMCEIYQPKTISAKEMEPAGEYTVFGANGPIGRYSKYNHVEPQLLVTCRGATCGTVNFSEPFSWITGNAMVIRPRDQRLTAEFLEYFFRGAVDWEGVITGAAQPQITRKSLAPVLVPTPPLDVQATIIDKLKATKTSSEQLVQKYNEKLRDLDDLRQSLLQKAFTGELF